MVFFDDARSNDLQLDPSPISKELISNSKYEDAATIARIGTAEMTLSSQFELFNQENLQNFYRLAGHIYSAADLAKLALEKRPNFEWNLFLPIVLAIVGDFKDSIPSVDFFGEGQLGERGANLHRILNNYYLYQANDIEYELAKAFLFAVVARIGWLKCNWSYKKDKKGMVEVEWYDSFRIKFDRNWRRRDTMDMRYMSDAGWYDVSELINAYAKNNIELRDEIYDKAMLIVGESALNKGRMRKMMQTWAETFLGGSGLAYQGAKHGYDSFNDAVNYNYNGTWYSGDGRFKCVDWYEKRQQPVMKITDLITQQSQDITDQVKKDRQNPFDESNWFDNDKLQQIRQQYQYPVIKETWEEIIWQVSVIPALNLKVYDEPMKVQNGYFKFIPILCYDFHPDIMETKSVVDSIVDPVSSYTMRRNTILTYLMKMGNGGWIAEQSAIKGHDDEFITNEIGALRTVADGALSGKKMMKDEPSQMPQGLMEDAQIEVSDIDKISGVPPAVRGIRESNKESGVLNRQRVSQSSVLQEWVSDNGQSSLLIVAVYLHSLAKRYLKMQRTLLIVNGEDDPFELELNVRVLDKIFNDVEFGEYVIKIAKQPAGRAATEQEFQKVMATNEWLAKNFGPDYVDPKIALKLSGLSVKNEMISHIKQVEQQKATAMADQQQQVQSMTDQQQKDADLQRMVQMNQAKLGLAKGLNDLHKSTLENRELSDRIASQSIMNKLFSSQTNGVQK